MYVIQSIELAATTTSVIATAKATVNDNWGQHKEATDSKRQRTKKLTASDRYKGHLINGSPTVVAAAAALGCCNLLLLLQLLS